jgi:SAM-dependent methyltransferase
MNWRVKAAVQRACAAMPVGGGSIYYSLQRAVGLLRDPERPIMMLRIAARLARELGQLGVDLRGKRVLEVGTGWRVDMPIGLYLCGAKSVDTYDLHRYLKPRLVMEAVAGLAKRRQLVIETLATVADAADVERRLDALVQAPDIRALLRVAGIEYRAPADATRIDRPAGSADVHVSFTVLQHIPYDALLALLREASRVLSADGLAWHQVDLSDQFASADPSISRANFLRFTDAEWARYSDNRFAYHNRLRADDYRRLYHEAEHEVIRWVSDVDERSRAELANGFPLAQRFRGLPVEMLATDTIRVLSRPTR